MLINGYTFGIIYWILKKLPKGAEYGALFSPKNAMRGKNVFN